MHITYTESIMYYIYRLTYPTGLYYVGKKKDDGAEYWGSGVFPRFYVAEYGTTNIEMEVLSRGHTKEEAVQEEARLLTHASLLDMYCTNLQYYEGGKTVTLSFEEQEAREVLYSAVNDAGQMLTAYHLYAINQYTAKLPGKFKWSKKNHVDTARYVDPAVAHYQFHLQMITRYT